jgi:hypothetical protein
MNLIFEGAEQKQGQDRRKNFRSQQPDGHFVAPEQNPRRDEDTAAQKNAPGQHDYRRLASRGLYVIQNLGISRHEKIPGAITGEGARLPFSWPACAAFLLAILNCFWDARSLIEPRFSFSLAA